MNDYKMLENLIARIYSYPGFIVAFAPEKT